MAGHETRVQPAISFQKAWYSFLFTARVGPFIAALSFVDLAIVAC